MQSFWDILLKKTFDSVPKNNTVLLHAVMYLLYDVRTTYFLFKSINAVKTVKLASAVLHNTQYTVVKKTSYDKHNNYGAGY